MDVWINEISLNLKTDTAAKQRRCKGGNKGGKENAYEKTQENWIEITKETHVHAYQRGLHSPPRHVSELSMRLLSSCWRKSRISLTKQRISLKRTGIFLARTATTALLNALAEVSIEGASYREGCVQGGIWNWGNPRSSLGANCVSVCFVYSCGFMYLKVLCTCLC